MLNEASNLGSTLLNKPTTSYPELIKVVVKGSSEKTTLVGIKTVAPNFVLLYVSVSN